ncbi:MAG: glycosyltransferase family 2 protein [Acidobacteria bacterium]|nr:glycosyltransferase family 2 protein [Acidobacteriota bacterium]
MSRPLLSVVTPAYNEADNLPLLAERLSQALDPADLDWEWVVVDDHSADDTFGVLARLAAAQPRIRALRFARNFGSHAAIACGLEEARGDAVVMLAADLQDPPEVIPRLLERWREGAHVVWAVRARRDGEGRSTLVFSRIYFWIMRHVVGLKEVAETGADFFLLDRRVVDAARRFQESHTSLLGLLAWLGFRQVSVPYDKQARRHGRSGWTLEKRLKLVADSVTSFTYLPIRLMSYVGLVVALLGFLYAGVVVVNALTGRPVQGWSSLMVVVLVIGGVQMLMMGVLGEYLWRAFDEARRRPRYIVESTLAADGDRSAAGAR